MTDTLRIVDPYTLQSTAWSWQNLINYRQTAPTRQTADSRGRAQTEPLTIDTRWYMVDGPGRYFNPARFPAVVQLLGSDPSALGLQSGESRSLTSLLLEHQRTASLSHYVTDVNSADWAQRGLVWGGTSGVIYGEVTNQGGRLVLNNYYVRPRTDNFNFYHDEDNRPKTVVNSALRGYYDQNQDGRGVPLEFSNSNSPMQSGYTSASATADLSRNANRNAVESPLSAALYLNEIAGFLGIDRCFPGSTPILMADGSQRAIQSIRPGDCVMAFDGAAGAAGSLVPRSVVRVFRNVTTEWLVLRPQGSPSLEFCELTVTPGHHFLTPRGGFDRIENILARDGAIVLRDGSSVTVEAKRVIYSADTASQYEQAEVGECAVAGSSAMAPQVKRGWATYNFEVAELHTYLVERL